MQAANSGNVGMGMSLGGTDAASQVMTGIAVVIVLYAIIFATEYIYKSFTTMWRDRVELFPKTYASGSKMYSAVQNPKNPKAKTVSFSDNQRSGIEFSYAMFTYLSSDTFSSGSANLYHILHKGYSKPYPLMGPGIFSWGNRNALRIFMNCFDTWDNYADIENIPVDKWFHLVVSCKGNTLYVYINGNLKSKLALSGNTPPYQNYGDVYAFSPRKQTINKTTTPSFVESPSSLVFDGAAKGMLSRVFYFGYALTYSEIQSLMNMGPSSDIEGPSMSITPYLSNTWWTNPQGP